MPIVTCLNNSHNASCPRLVDADPAGADPRILELLSADGQGRRTAVPLPQGSLFVLGDLTNQQYLHSVRPEGSSGSVNNKKPSASATSRAAGGGSSGSAYQQARISFTLRRCATFIDPALANGGGGRNHLVGQGAQYRMAPDGTVRPYICQLPSPKTLALLYHDSHFVAIAKPSGWSIEEPAQDAAAEAISESSTGSAGGSMQAEPSVLPWLREQLFLVAAERPPNHGGETEETGGDSAISPTTVHHKFYAVAGLPVEQAVSGVVLLARSSHAAQAMAAMLAQPNAPCRATAPAIGSSSGSSQVSLMPARPDCEVSWLAAVSGVVPSSLQVTRALSKKQQPNKSARKAAARRAGKAARARERQPQQPQQSVGGGLSACCSYLPLPADLSAQNLPPPTLAPDDPPCHCTSFERVAALWEHEGAARISLLRASVRWQSAADSLQNPRRSEPMVAAAPVRHQVRRHLAGAAFPILGDSQYGKGRINRWLREEYHLTRPFLHVERLSVPHPLFIQAHCSRSGSSSGEGAHVQHPSASGQKNTGRKIDVSAELAEDLVAFLRRIPDASKTARATTADATAASPATNASDDDDGVEASTRARVLRQLGIEEE